MAWNKDDQDLVAAAYGEFDFSVDQKDGAIALWSLKNPTHPERVYTVPCGVTAIDWSGYHPFLLAVGLYGGHMAQACELLAYAKPSWTQKARAQRVFLEVVHPGCDLFCGRLRCPA